MSTPERARGRLDELRAALPAGWWVGTPSYYDERREWLLYAFDPSEKPIVGVRKREWTAVAPTAVGVVRDMARGLREIAAGGVPKSLTRTGPTETIRRLRMSARPLSRLVAAGCCA